MVASCLISRLCLDTQLFEEEVPGVFQTKLVHRRLCGWVLSVVSPSVSPAGERGRVHQHVWAHASVLAALRQKEVNTIVVAVVSGASFGTNIDSGHVVKTFKELYASFMTYNPWDNSSHWPSKSCGSLNFEPFSASFLNYLDLSLFICIIQLTVVPARMLFWLLNELIH